MAGDGPASLRQSPQTHGLVVAPSQRPLAVRGEGHAADTVRVAREAVQFLARLQVPQPQRVVLAAGQRALTAGRERDASDLVGVALEPAQLFARLDVPEL